MPKKKVQKIQIRQMTIDDIPEVYKLGKSAFIDEKGTNRSYVYGYWSLSQIAKIAEEYLDLAYVAVDQGKIIGLILGHPSYEHITEVGYLEWLAVDKNYRRKGIAQDLIKKNMPAFKKRGLKRLVTDVKGKNLESSSLFKDKFGFRIKESVNFLEGDIQ